LKDIDTPSWFPFNPATFRGKLAAGMNPKQAGAFMFLVCAAWFETPPASLPPDDSVLALASGFGEDVASWLGVKSVVLSGWTCREDGRLTLPWLRELYDRAAAKSRTARESANAKRSLSERTAFAPHTRSDSGSSSPPFVRLVWNQVSPLYRAYARFRRSSKGAFQRAVEPAWGVLLTRGESDPLAVLLPATEAYAASWQGQQAHGAVGPEKFYAADGVWEQDPHDWCEPAAAVPTPIDLDALAARVTKGRSQ
jgi:uncharacterized protein YdaU (DUF1376 family)